MRLIKLCKIPNILQRRRDFIASLASRYMVGTNFIKAASAPVNTECDIYCPYIVINGLHVAHKALSDP